MSRGRKNRNRGEVFSSRMKAFASFLEQYTDGVFKGGWKNVSGSWSVVSSRATTSSSSSYPIRTVVMSNPNSTISIVPRVLKKTVIKARANAESAPAKVKTKIDAIAPLMSSR